MFLLRSRGLILTYLLTVFFSCGGNKIPVAEDTNASKFPARKAYVVIRSEGGPQNVQRVRNTLAADFSENNVRTEYSLYRAKQPWNQNEIFNTAYNGQYDYIILIDQVAKITIDNNTQVGGKYQIRSYHVKSPNPNWLDLGKATCNLTVKPSVQKFSREIIRSIVGNQAAFKGHDLEFDESIAMNQDADSEDSNPASNEITSEIESLRKELEAEKRRTLKAEEERKKLENQLKIELEVQKQKARIAQIEAEEAALKKRERQREITEEYAAKREAIKQREAEEAAKKPIVLETEPEEPTREERISQREELKRRMAEERATKRQEAAAAAAARKEERIQLERLEKEERRRLKEELEAQRKENNRLAEEDLKRIREKVAEERRQAEELARQKKEAEKLAAEKLKEEQRHAKEREAELEKQAKIDKEAAEILAKEERKARRIAREEEARRQEAELKAQRLKEKREAELKLAELQKQEQLKLEEEKRLASELAAQQNEAKKQAKNRREAQERLAEQKRMDEALAKQREEQVRLAEAQRLEQERATAALEAKREQAAIEAQKMENERLTAASQKTRSKNQSRTKTESGTTGNVSKTLNAYVVIRGKAEDRKQFQDLEDHIEFDFMFAKIKSKTTIFDLDQSESLSNVIQKVADEHNIIILINQMEYLGDGKSRYEIKSINRPTDSDWNTVNSLAFNLNLKADLKQLSKKITEYLSK